MYYAQIDTNTRIVMACTMAHGILEGEHLVEITEEQYSDVLGKRHVLETDTFEVVPPARRVELPKIDYLKRFTPEERIAIRNLAKTNDEAFDYIELMNAASTIHLDDPLVVSGLAKFEQAGLLAQGRSAEIRA